MSVNKLLGRIVAPKNENEEQGSDRELHDNTYGLTSDPLTQFAIVLSALIHDVDHYGVANALGFISYLMTGLVAWIYLRQGVREGGKP